MTRRIAQFRNFCHNLRHRKPVAPAVVGVHGNMPHVDAEVPALRESKATNGNSRRFRRWLGRLLSTTKPESREFATETAYIRKQDPAAYFAARLALGYCLANLAVLGMALVALAYGSGK